MPYEEHDVFGMPDDLNVPIWRYMDFTKFVSLLDKKALFFTRADRFSDAFEGSYPQATVSARAQYYQSTWGAAPDLMEAMPNFLENWSEQYRYYRQYTFINCWHVNEVESTAMWELYSKSNEGIAIQSSVARLKASFGAAPHSIFIGTVKYIDYQRDFIPDNNVLSAFVHKRKSFEQERELRAVMWGLRPEPPPFGHYIPVDLQILIDRIYVAPLSPGWFRELVGSILKLYQLEKEVVQSDLERDPVY